MLKDVAVPDANGAGSEESVTQPLFRRLTSASDVICTMKSMTNAGRASGAGVVSGASHGQRSDSNPEVRECGLSRSR